jgi:DNA-binding PadR family transcriptional regulator
VLELAILGLLKEQELHGYELKKRLGETLGSGSAVSFGSLYPALSRLEAAGAVKAVEAAGAGGGWAAGLIPGTGSLGGELAAFRARKVATRGSRGKKVYGITSRGELLFEELLAAESSASDDERVFHLRLAFARYLPRDARLGLLERRRAFLLERLAHTHSAIRNGWERLDAYTRSLLEHGHETTERDISWLDRLIAREREVGQDPGRTPDAPTSVPGEDGPSAPPSAPPVPARDGAPAPPAAEPVAVSLTTVPVAVPLAVAIPADALVVPLLSLPASVPGSPEPVAWAPFPMAAPSAPTPPVPPAATQEGTTP